MPTLSDLLADSHATTDIIAAITYLSPDLLEGNPVEYIEYVSQYGWTDPADGPLAAYIPPLLDLGLEISQHLEPLDIASSFGAYSQLVLVNDLTIPEYKGRYDGWHRNSIDNRPITLYLVGVLSTGERVELSDVLLTPLFELRGVGIPEPGDSRCTLNVRDGSHTLDQALQPTTYSPPCLLFPGTPAGYVDFGDVFNVTGSFSAADWVWLEDPTIADQYVFYKLNGASTSGYLLLVGSVVGIAIGGQTPVPTLSASNILHARQWHYVSFNVDVAAGTREIGVDGVAVATTVGVTGTPSASTGIDFLWGTRLKGKLSRWTIWNTAKTTAAMWAEARTPVLATDPDLIAWLETDEGEGDTVHDRVNGSSITGSIGAGILWDIASWHHPAIAGTYRPYVLGTVPRVPVIWVDPANQIGEVSYGGCALISEMQSNHNTLGEKYPDDVAGIWTSDLARGTIEVISGALSGTYSATVTANNLWGTALQVSSISKILASTFSVSGACTICVQFTPDASQVGGNIIGWRDSAVTPGTLCLRYGSGSANRLEALCINDAGTAFACTTNVSLKEGRTYSLALTRDPTALILAVSVDGEEVEAVSITGAFTASISVFGVGIRGDGTLGTQAYGRYDEPLVFSRVLTQDEIRALHALPATGSETGLVKAWHLNEGTGSTGGRFAGATDLTLTDVTWVGGRSCAADLARVCYYAAGYTASELDTATWTDCVSANPSDCGWFVTGGESILSIAQLILGGLGFLAYELYGVVYVRRFEGPVGVPVAVFSTRADIKTGDIEAEGHDPAVWEWRVLYAHNNVKMDAANIAGVLASTDPERYQYGQVEDLTAMAFDHGIKKIQGGLADGRFPNAVPKTRQTALLHRRDAEDEAARLLALHRHAADVKAIPMWLLPEPALFAQEVAFDIPECEIDQSDWMVTGIEVRDGETRATIWRPAVTEYTVTMVTDEGDVVVTDEGDVVVIDAE